MNVSRFAGNSETVLTTMSDSSLDRQDWAQLYYLGLAGRTGTKFSKGGQVGRQAGWGVEVWAQVS